MELTSLVKNTPRVGLNFAKIFDFDAANVTVTDENDPHGMPPSPTARKEKELKEKEKERERNENSSSPVNGRSASPSITPGANNAPLMRVRRPSIRKSGGLPPPLSVCNYLIPSYLC